jgi:hypothetical protein
MPAAAERMQTAGLRTRLAVQRRGQIAAMDWQRLNFHRHATG